MLLNISAENPTPADVRLIFGESTYEGIVQIKHQGKWGTVCDHEWDNNDAKVSMLEVYGCTVQEGKMGGM